MKTRKNTKIICALNIQEPGPYTEKGFLKWLNGLNLKEHCKNWDIYKKELVPDWKEQPCPSDPKDVEGWMKHYSAKYTTRKQCVDRTKQLAATRKRHIASDTKVLACHKKHCGKITKQLFTLIDEKREPCNSLKSYSLLSNKFFKSPQMKCYKKVGKLPEVKKLTRQEETCKLQNCKKERKQNELYFKQIINAAEQKHYS